MNQSLVHRGPDDSGIHLDGPVGLAQTRLSIIDLSSAGHQPMSNEDGTVWVVFNGEIYNHQDLRPSLENAGHRFVGTSDTQVIIHAYEEYGIEGCLERLRGMFAFGIWDSRKEVLFLARDRIGKKPLKYYVDAQGMIFASELKAILTNSRVVPTVDYQAIDLFLTHASVPAPYTGFAGIKKLPPAHYLTCTLRGEVQVKRYWDLKFRTDHHSDREQWKTRILAELDEAVRIRMIADVPIGAFLSGGVDSSAVVASMALQSGRPIKTFSIGFTDSKQNELPYARQVAERYKTEHTEIIVEPGGMNLLEKLVFHYEEPYADSSALPTYCVAEATRKHVTVALNGDGGDEAFAGYPWYRWVQRMGPLEPLRPFFALGSYPANWMFQLRPNRRTRRTAVLLSSYRRPAAGRHYEWLAYFSDMEKKQLYTPDFARHRVSSTIWDIVKEAPTSDPVDRALYTDIRSYLPDDLQVKVDIACMAVSLEGRSPMLDHRFLEFASTIPSKFKIGNGGGKAILKEALESRLPHNIMYRRKQGFSIPADRWFREEWKAWSREVLLDSRTLGRGLFSKVGLERLLAQHESGVLNHGHRIWTLITLELWFRRFFDSRSAGQPKE